MERASPRARSCEDAHVRLVVYGAGAIGGVVGARCFQHGHDVVLIARGTHLRTIQERGLTLQTPDETVTLPIPAVGSPAKLTIGADDVVMLAMKSQDTLEALESLRSVAPSSVPIVCAQNGVVNERIALRRFANVYGLCVMCPASHLEPGVVQASSSPVTGLMDLGRWPSGTDELADGVAAMLSSATFSSESRSDIPRWKWGKLLMNLGNAVEAICGHDEEGLELVALAREEGVACLEAAGIEFVDSAEDGARRAGLLTPRPVAGARRGGGSTWQSLTRSLGSVETDYLTGEIVLLGRLHGVATPVNALLQELVVEMARHHEPPGTRAASDVLALVATRR